jgi:hypothetical protein
MNDRQYDKRYRVRTQKTGGYHNPEPSCDSGDPAFMLGGLILLCFIIGFIAYLCNLPPAQ